MMEPLGVAGASGCVATRPPLRLQQFCFRLRRLFVHGGQTKAANEHGKAKIRGLAKLAVQERDESRGKNMMGKISPCVSFLKLRRPSFTVSKVRQNK